MNAKGSLTPAATLPASAGRLIGRAAEVSTILEELRGGTSRLLTLWGAGGIGKTRLALEVARAAAPAFPDGARFVDLTPYREPELVLSAIAAAVDIHRVGSRPPLEALKRALHSLHLLLVLDNFEQALPAAPLLADLLTYCPRLTLLVTSRSPLRLTWEREFAVRPLEIPSADLDGRPAELIEVPSVALLLERMGSVGATSVGADGHALAAICRRLDGIPLAIELAAARARLLPPRALLEHLEQPLRVLSHGARDLPARHQSLRETFDWSYQLLPEADRTLFRRLGVFVGGCALEHAAQVCGGTVASDPEFLDCIARLVESSLVRITASEGGAEPRLSLLEPVREYALECLAASGEETDTRLRHATVYLALAKAADSELKGPQQRDWLGRLERDHGNVLGAMSWLTETRDIERALSLAAYLCWFWWVRGLGREGLQRVEDVLTLAATEPDNSGLAMARARALSGAGILTYSQGDFQAATDYLEAALALYTAAGVQHGQGFALNMLGNCAHARNELERAEELYGQSIELHRAANNRRGLAQVVVNLGLVAFSQRKLDRSFTLLSEGLALEREVGDPRGVAFALGPLGIWHALHGQLERAVECLRESFSLCQEVGDRAYLPMLLEQRAMVAAIAGDHERALRVAAGAAALREDLAVSSPPVWVPTLQQWMETARAALGDSASNRAWQEGRAAGLEPTLALALSAGSEAESTEQRPARLSARELEVLRLLASGDTNKEIAANLVLSVATVERHIANVYAKIGARGRAEATAFAITRGLLQPRAD